MKKLTQFFLLPAFALAFSISAAQADTLSKAEAQELVQPFYDMLSRKATAGEASASLHADWISYYSADGYKTLDQTMGFLTGPLVQMVPDLNWEIKSVSVTTDNEIVVRGEATGTPVGKAFFGQPVSGKSFKIMSIDIHTVKDGKISKSYHIEDWAGALKQLAGKS
ncbi:ester cyclase [Terasakiella sp. A23]|uniref:ester cyclase n=1 Tax=Terasakiella sp. FCG-A23 TaxID=3080561 RepID=UPI0029559F12|nr:ester cyclase [Terasakiella sp. A23]MDV7338369.1 ester cyclase [Terasakiella sp. A23]